MSSLCLCLFLSQLEDATFATSSATKARQNLEAELSELQAQSDLMMKAKSDVSTQRFISSYMYVPRRCNTHQTMTYLYMYSVGTTTKKESIWENFRNTVSFGVKAELQWICRK